MATILVVDDQPVNRELLATLLGYQNHRVYEAADGAEALELVRHHRPDLVICDLLMPTMDGYEFVRRLRQEEDIASTPVVFYTAHYLLDEAQSLARACGVSHIITKGCEPEAILRIVQDALGVSPAEQPAPPAENFEREHLRLLTNNLVEQVARLESSNRRLETLIQLGQQLSLERDPLRLLERFCQAARGLIGADCAVIGIHGRDGRSIRHFCRDAAPEVSVHHLRHEEVLSTLCERLVLTEQPVRYHAGDNGHGCGPLHLTAIRSFLGVPVRSPTESYGWLCLIDKEGGGEFTGSDQDLATSCAAVVAVAYENAARFNEIQHYITRMEDEVTRRRRAQEDLQRRVEFENLLTNISTRFINLPVTETDSGIASALESMGRFLAVDFVALFTIGDDRASAQPTHAWCRTGVGPIAPRPVRCPWTIKHLSGRGDFYLADAIEPESEAAGVDRAAWNDLGLHVVYGVRLPSGSSISGFLLVGSVRSDLPRRDLQHLHLASQILANALERQQSDQERRRLESQLQHAQKLESLGVLAGGIAHDFNNLLTVITGNVELLRSTLSPEDDNDQILADIANAARHAADMTRSLQSFSRPPRPQVSYVDANRAVDDVYRMLQRLIPPTVDLTLDPDVEPCPVAVDLTQFHQLLVNLCVNARDAMPSGGVLSVQVRKVPRAHLRGGGQHRYEHYVLIRVTDTGCGMDAETLKRVFDPFFTTKTKDRGTGLGLAIVYKIVQAHDGWIDVESEVGRGSRFNVYLPAAGCDGLDEPAVPLEVASADGRANGSIVVVDDEEMVGTLLKHMLERQGYTVTLFHEPLVALEALDRDDLPLDLLIVDYLMPQMTGDQLASHARQRRPGLPVLMVTGHGISEEEITDPNTFLLHKPFNAQTIMERVQQLISGSLAQAS